MLYLCSRITVSVFIIGVNTFGSALQGCRAVLFAFIFIQFCVFSVQKCKKMQKNAKKCKKNAKKFAHIKKKL